MTTGTQSTVVEKVGSCEPRHGRIGGKAAGLYRLSRLGFRVAPFFVLPTNTFDEHVAPVRALIQRTLTAADGSTTSEIVRVSRSVRWMIRECPMSPAIKDRIERNVRTTFRRGTKLAVRSSAVDEDSAGASFAGMLDSRLNIPPEAAAAAVVEVWESAFSEHALAYRIQKNLSLEDITVAVVIQEMVPTRVSGVMFTSSLDGGEGILVSAGYGLGDGIVSGTVETDTYRLPGNGHRPEIELTAKRRQVVPCKGNGGGTTTVPVPRRLINKPSLRRKQWQELQTAGVQLEEALGSPQDIEWGYDKHGRLFIMQARPITAPLAAPRYERERIFDNANIVESYPGITLPLTFSFISRNYAAIFHRAACGLVWNKKRLAERTDIWTNLLAYIKGRVYYNLSAWYEMLSHLPVFKSYRPVWDAALGVSASPDRDLTPLSIKDRLYCLARLAGLLIFVRRGPRRFLHRCNPALAGASDRNYSTMNETELLGCYRSLERLLIEIWPATLYNDICAFVYDYLLRKLCARWAGSEAGKLYHQLSAGATGIESVRPLESLRELAALFASRESYREVLALDDAEAWRRILVQPQLASLRTAIEEHIDRYGDRCFEELKLESRSYRDDPAALLGLIRAAGSAPSPPPTPPWNGQVYVRGWLKRLVLKAAAGRARTAICNRETMRFARTRAYGTVRRIFRQLGARMAERKLLHHADDIFYLTVDEVFGAVEGTGATAEIASLVDLRREEFSSYASIRVPGRFTAGTYPAFTSFNDRARAAGTGYLVGTGCVAGEAKGPAKIVTDPKAAGNCTGAVLVTETTDPSWVFLMMQARAIVSERGSVLSHTAIVGRELGIPTVVGVPGAAEVIPGGAEVTVNGDTGEVSWN